MATTAYSINHPWLDRAYERVMQEPLIQSQPSTLALDACAALAAPKAVFMGIGLCSRSRLSVALPADILGMILPAEQLRQSINATTWVVLVADTHALANNLPFAAVEERARATIATLERIKQALGLHSMQITRASRLHQTRGYQEVLQEVRRRSPANAHEYIQRQVADVAYCHRHMGGIIKVGWSLSAKARGEQQHDETMFDARLREWLGTQVPFVYCKPGRVLCDRRKKAPPYIAFEAAQRICLHPKENVPAKLQRAAALAGNEAVNGVANHLRALTTTFCRSIEHLQGSPAQRMQTIIAKIFASPAPMPLLAENARRRRSASHANF